MQKPRLASTAPSSLSLTAEAAECVATLERSVGICRFRQRQGRGHHVHLGRLSSLGDSGEDVIAAQDLRARLVHAHQRAKPPIGRR